MAKKWYEDKDEQCSKCKFSFPDHAYPNECRRHAPTSSGEYPWQHWPHINSNDWCGEFERKL